jgi:hypothetical protein
MVRIFAFSILQTCQSCWVQILVTDIYFRQSVPPCVRTSIHFSSERVETSRSKKQGITRTGQSSRSKERQRQTRTSQSNTNVVFSSGKYLNSVDYIQYSTMGSGLSKHEDEVKADNRERAAALASAPKSEAIQIDSLTAQQTSDANTRDTESACPMKMKDGSYTMDWGALFRPAFPHGIGGKKPLTEEQAREKVGKPENTTTTTTTTPTKTLVAAGAGEGCPVKHEVANEGCPVKHQEYNVYSQPIDPNNNMPTSANQLRGPGQTKDLPTDRVKSSIGKVSRKWVPLFSSCKRLLH